MSKYESRLFIGGNFRDSKEGGTFQLVNPGNNKEVANLQIASPADVDECVALAEKAQPAWEAQPAAVRANVLRKLGSLIAENGKYLAELDSVAMGRPQEQYETHGDVALCASYCNYFAGLTENVHGQSSLLSPGMINMTIRQPFGVCAAIIPWNVPMLMWVWKVFPSLGAGNALILKSSEKAPLSPLFLAKLAKDAGVPDGVLSVISGAGQVGELLSSHMRIRKIAFTGSTRTGRLVQQSAARSNLKNVKLELGGKSACVVFDDANIEAAVAGAAFSIEFNAGQICICNSRLYVHEKVFDSFVGKLKDALSTVKHGDPQSAGTRLGPQADKIQSTNVQKYLDIGNQEGKALLGGRKADGMGSDNYIQPTIFTDISDDSRINKEEVFGPVVVVHKFSDEAEVLRRANDTEYGLYAAVFTQDIDRALRFARGLESGTVGVNCTSPTLVPDMAFGGTKTSGVGRELGSDAVLDWLECKAVLIKYNP